MAADDRADDRLDGTPGADLERAITAVVRWAGRTDARRELVGPTADGLSAVDVTMLQLVVDHGPVRASDLADLQGVDKSTVTPQVRRLEERGMLAREPDPSDGRASLLTVTARGSRTNDEIHAAGAAVFDAVLSEWPDGDRRTIARLLSRFADDLAHRGAPPDPHAVRGR